MYKPIDKLQHSFLDFNQPLGLHMNPDNRWIKLADRIPWDTFAKSRKRTAKKIRSALRRQLGYVKRDLGYLEQFMSDGYAMTGKDIGLYLTIIRLYEQQQYMYDNRVHSVEHRIICIRDESFQDSEANTLRSFTSVWHDWNRYKSWKLRISA